MSSSINPLSSSYLQSIVSSALQGVSSTTNKTNNTLSGIDPSTGQQPDSGQLSPFAQLLNTLQQLEQSNPGQYQQVTQQISTNLQSAAQTAQSSGNTTAANQLNQLATDFTNASKSGQLPNVQDLAHAISGHHHHHHGHAASAASSDSSTSGSSTSSSTTSASQSLSQLLAAYQTNSGQSDPLNPMNIILNTLSTSGIGG